MFLSRGTAQCVQCFSPWCALRLFLKHSPVYCVDPQTDKRQWSANGMQEQLTHVRYAVSRTPADASKEMKAKGILGFLDN